MGTWDRTPRLFFQNCLEPSTPPTFCAPDPLPLPPRDAYLRERVRLLPPASQSPIPGPRATPTRRLASSARHLGNAATAFDGPEGPTSLTGPASIGWSFPGEYPLPRTAL